MLLMDGIVRLLSMLGRGYYDGGNRAEVAGK